jgi:hypothetical protein
VEYFDFQMSAYSFENQNTTIIRVLSFHFAVGKMKTAIIEKVGIAGQGMN